MKAQTNQSLRCLHWAHRSFCWFCPALAEMFAVSDLSNANSQSPDLYGGALGTALIENNILV